MLNVPFFFTRKKKSYTDQNFKQKCQDFHDVYLGHNAEKQVKQNNPTILHLNSYFTNSYFCSVQNKMV